MSDKYAYLLHLGLYIAHQLLDVIVESVSLVEFLVKLPLKFVSLIG